MPAYDFYCPTCDETEERVVRIADLGFQLCQRLRTASAAETVVPNTQVRTVIAEPCICGHKLEVRIGLTARTPERWKV